MPQFSEFDGMTQVSYITGPSHVLLAIDFVSSPPQSIQIVKRPAIGNCHHGCLDGNQLERAVVKVISELNQEYRRNLYPRKIAYVENDSNRIELYCVCTNLLYQKYLES